MQGAQKTEPRDVYLYTLSGAVCSATQQTMCSSGYDRFSRAPKSLYPLLRVMNSTYKYYGTAFVIFEFHSFDLQASVADDLQVVHFVSEAWVSLLLVFAHGSLPST
jgi:hypothetical protein